MSSFVHLSPFDPRYPTRLLTMTRPPTWLTVRGGSLEASHVVAIVGSRDADPRAEQFARELGGTLARAGVVALSGGAKGIDAAVHRGALDIPQGRTWAVAGTGCEHCFPPEHAALFDEIGSGPGAMLWPFPPSSVARSPGFLSRNRVLIALADAVVVAQAGFPSGALSAAACARKAGKPLWVVPAPPWAKGFEGTLRLLEQGARPLAHVEAFLRSLAVPGTAEPMESGQTDEMFGLGTVEAAVLHATSSVPQHLDEIATRAHVAVQVAAATLLTLSLEAVVVEDPPGFFRRRGCHKLSKVLR